jgi:hypothetical protein
MPRLAAILASSTAIGDLANRGTALFHQLFAVLFGQTEIHDHRKMIRPNVGADLLVRDCDLLGH